MNLQKALIISLLCGAITAFFYFDVGQHLTLENIKAQQDSLSALYQQAPLQCLLLFFFGFTLYASLPMPGLILWTLLGAAIFGFLPTFIIVSFGTAIGGTMAFWGARYVLRDSLEQRYPQQFKTINDGVEQEGGFYLFSIRLMPLFPFFLVNLLMGLTNIRSRDFYLITQAGMLAVTAVFVNAGTQLSQIESVSSLFSPSLILSFALMGIIPLLSKKIITYFSRQIQ